ncbi:MAG: hypothetical protein MK364_10170, partial [Pirellulales bacterium]|nr:hypothetical protein [Pirellulales bacterium]
QVKYPSLKPRLANREYLRLTAPELRYYSGIGYKKGHQTLVRLDQSPSPGKSALEEPKITPQLRLRP